MLEKRQQEMREFMEQTNDVEGYARWNKERNEVEIHKNFKGSRTDLVNKINRFYTQTSDRNDLMHNFNFNLPQYFILTDNNRALHPFTISNS